MLSVNGDTFYDWVTDMSHTNFFPLSSFDDNNYCVAASSGPFGGQNF